MDGRPGTEDSSTEVDRVKGDLGSILIMVGIIVAYLIVMKWVLPRMGVST